MRAVVIDDESNLRQTTKALLSVYCPEVEVLGEADGVATGMALIKSQKPDLVFLDVEMADGTGFDIMHAFPQRDFAVIFITAHDDYAVRAFKFSAIDYILKPIDPDDLERAVKKAIKKLDSGVSGLHLKALESNLKVPKLKRIVLRDAEKVYLVDISEIIRCESDDNYTNFYLTEGRKILVSNTLKEYETLFVNHDFFRCHQSHLINLHFFDHFDKREGGSICLKDGSVLPVSVRKREQLMKVLESY
jgi:two-component system, LytTR family, response regulator